MEGDTLRLYEIIDPFLSSFLDQFLGDVVDSADETLCIASSVVFMAVYRRTDLRSAWMNSNFLSALVGPDCNFISSTAF